jgi:hypothetical protein
MNESDTPRTDAEINKLGDRYNGLLMVLAFDWARRLERELYQAKAQISYLHDQLEQMEENQND